MTQQIKKLQTVTPMMQQYLLIKESHKEYLLFYRMGDFYELFFDDAVTASETLDITLTKRGKHDGADIPMCGVPVHSSTSYLHKLIKNGFKVAICEQMESPEEAKKRGGAKSVVRREVTRIITSGTLTEDTLLDSKTSNFLASIAVVREEIGLSWLDISTGEFLCTSASINSISSELSRIDPKELLVSDKLLEDQFFRKILAEWKSVLTTHVPSFFDSEKGKLALEKFYKVTSLSAFGDFTKSELGSCGALIEYIALTQKSTELRLTPPKKLTTSNFMSIDSATRRNLELTRTTNGEYKGSLLSVIDKTVTSSGARLLYDYLSAPLLEPSTINNRFDMVEFFTENQDMRNNVRSVLKHTPDMERSLSRICAGRCNPRDLTVVRDGIAESITLSGMFEFGNLDYPSGISSLISQLGNHDILLSTLKDALTDIVPHNLNDGGFIREHYSPKLDEYRNIRKESESLKNELRTQYRDDTKITSLKIKENNVLGIFIEVTPQHVDSIPDSFIHRQTLAGAVRYTTVELRELENKIINSKGYAFALEMEIFENLRQKIISQAEEITLTAHAVAGFDVMSALAELAIEKRYVRPTIDNSTVFDIKDGRHPVVELVTEDTFISNNCDLSEKQKLWLITGPNMAGKSTFLRQNALIAILAQIGSFIPASSAHIGAIDTVFSRVGAADDLARGQSTFMIEMVETATILNHATPKSLVILDEIGRGTATFDGLSIAWAVIEYIHNVNKSRTLFATHYHELTLLSSKLESLSCHTVKVREWNDDIIFLHEVIDGVANRSYGIHVGKIAGLPKIVIERSEEILKTLQEGETGGAVAKLADDLPLFSINQKKKEESKTEIIIKETDIDSLSPRQALDLLYKLALLLDKEM